MWGESTGTTFSVFSRETPQIIRVPTAMGAVEGLAKIEDEESFFSPIPSNLSVFS